MMPHEPAMNSSKYGTACRSSRFCHRFGGQASRAQHADRKQTWSPFRKPAASRNIRQNLSISRFQGSPRPPFALRSFLKSRQYGSDRKLFALISPRHPDRFGSFPHSEPCRFLRFALRMFLSIPRQSSIGQSGVPR